MRGKRSGGSRIKRWFACASLLMAGLAASTAALNLDAQGTITAQFPRLDWQPTQAIPGAHYAGSKACAKCHARETSTQLATPMAHAMELPADAKILARHTRLTYRLGRYSYLIQHEGPRSIYSVTDGAHTISAPILWAFGLGEAGQTYVFEANGSYYQSMVSFFNDVQRFDITLGAPRTPAATLDAALGAVITEKEARLCFGCHSTGSVTATGLDVDRLVPGVTCEGCHGPGAAHIDAVQKGEFQTLRIFNPGRLSAGDLADFCGSCHRSSLQVGFMQVHGVDTVRFQPYRLTNSRCYDPDDARISCIACHDPHRQLHRDATFYDAKCLACHTSRSGASRPRAKSPAAESKAAGASPCPVGQARCVTCHMKKYELPGGHFKFTDHWIRVVKAGAPYPD